MKEQKVVCKMVYDYDQAKNFEALIQKYISEGWQIVYSEHASKVIMLVLEREKLEATCEDAADNIKQVEYCYKTGYEHGSIKTGYTCINLLKQKADKAAESTRQALLEIIKELEQICQEDDLINDIKENYNG